MDDLRAKGVAVTSEPRPLSLPNRPAINYSYAWPDQPARTGE